jgi:hypothetical protein
MKKRGSFEIRHLLGGHKSTAREPPAVQFSSCRNCDEESAVWGVKCVIVCSCASLLCSSVLQNWKVGRDSSVGIATRYGLDGTGIESRWGRDFPHPSRPSLGPTQLPIQWVPGLFPGGKVAGAWRGVDHLPSSNAEVKERIELYLYPFSGPSWPVLG